MADGDQGAKSWWGRFCSLPNDNPLKTAAIALAVAFVGSVMVASSAVLLRPYQIAYKEAERQKHFAEIIHQIPGFEERLRVKDGIRIEARVVDLESGEYVPSIEAPLFDQRRAAKDLEKSIEIPSERDLAGLKRRARRAVVYLIQEDKRTKLVILPVRGRGFGSMLYGYLGLAGDVNTVIGLTFYEHAETPGLGALVDSPSWKIQWRGKKVRDEGGILMLGVGSMRIEAGSPEALYQVDALTGATWTGNGVTNLLHYWLGDHGFGSYLRKLEQQ